MFHAGEIESEPLSKGAKHVSGREGREGARDEKKEIEVKEEVGREEEGERRGKESSGEDANTGEETGMDKRRREDREEGRESGLEKGKKRDDGGNDGHRRKRKWGRRRRNYEKKMDTWKSRQHKRMVAHNVTSCFSELLCTFNEFKASKVTATERDFKIRWPLLHLLVLQQDCSKGR